MITLPRRHEIQDMKSAILKVSDYLGNDVVFSPKDSDILLFDISIMGAHG